MKICPQCMRQYGDDVEVCEDDGERLREFRDQASRMVGQVLDGRWAIEEKIAEGGMGEVYRAHQVTMERVVAVKLIRSGLAGSEEFVARFFREANILASIQHPHLVTIYDYGQAANEVLYIAMEYLDGMALGARMHRSPLGLAEIVKVGAQICAALDVAHKNQVVHRDLKPDNVFLLDVEDDIFVKVLDFGIAKQLDSNHTPVTRTGQVFGTPEYMSPEQCDNVELVDQRSDLYSLGVILYELLCGALPFDATAAIKIMVAKITEPAVPLAERGVPIPDELARLVMELLAMDPDDRVPTAAETRRRLEEVFDWLRGHPEALDAFSDARAPTVDHDEAGTRRFDAGTRKKRRAEVGHKLLTADQIAFDAPDELSVAASVAPASVARTSGAARKSPIPAVATVALIVILAGGALALPSVRRAVFGPAEKPSKPVPLGPSPAARKAVVNEAEAGVAEGIDSARFAPWRDEGTSTAEEVRFNAAVFAASLPDSRVDAEPTARPAGTRAPKKKVGEEETPAGMLSFRTRSSIDRKARRYQNQLIPCYEARADASLEGAINFQFRITPDGTVDFFEMKSNAFDDGVESCVRDKVVSWTFRKGIQGSGFDTHSRTVTFRRSE